MAPGIVKHSGQVVRAGGLPLAIQENNHFKAVHDGLFSSRHTTTGLFIVKREFQPADLRFRQEGDETFRRPTNFGEFKLRDKPVGMKVVS